MECPSCGQPSAPGHAFCGFCGVRLGQQTEPTPPTPPEGEAERRQLTVLFCDLAASTELGQRLDAEELRDVIRRFHLRASRIVEEHAGYVAQYLGDGLLVYFGYPRALGDDAERAIDAGLAILAALPNLNAELERTLGVKLSARIGVHTGAVVVGAMGRSREALAHGDTVNVAARIEQFAALDALLISEETLRLVRGLFVTEDLGAQSLKGIRRPLTLHRVLRRSPGTDLALQR